MDINSKEYRKPLDDCLVNMATSSYYQKNALFYFHILTQMNIVMSPTLPAPCGVSFTHNHFNLYVNMELFNEYSLEERIFILIHECLHCTMGHLGEDGRLSGPNIDHENANYAEDCSINQMINMTIPESAIVPDNLLKDKTVYVKPNMNSEFYYNLLKDNEKDDSNQNDKSDDGDGDSQGSGNPNKSQGKRKPIDTHDTWAESTGDKDLQKDITAQLIEKAIEETVKDRGTLPQNIEHMMNMFKRKVQIDWKKVLRNIVGNKRVGKTPTIRKRSRRFQNRADIKGYQKDRMFELVVFVDISGSMNDSEVLQGLNEISSICKTFNTTMKLIQIDTEVHKVEEFSKRTKLFDRRGAGGTIMEKGADYLFKSKIQYDAIIFISDMYVEDIRQWKKQPKCKVMWLATSDCIPEWNGWGKHKVYPIKVKEV